MLPAMIRLEMPPIFFIQTLPSKRLARVEKSRSSSPPANASSTLYGTMESAELSRKLSEPHSFKSLLSKSVIRALCGSGFALSFLAGGFEVVFVLYCYSAVEDGGLGLPVSWAFASCLLAECLYK
jgi:hypothetical protein